MSADIAGGNDASLDSRSALQTLSHLPEKGTVFGLGVPHLSFQVRYGYLKGVAPAKLARDRWGEPLK